MLDKNLIVFDVETTGTDPETSSVIQIGAVKISKDMIIIDEPIQLLIKPYKNFWSKEAENVHGTSFEFLLEYGLDLQDALERFIYWIAKPKEIYLAQWSCGFDTDMLKSAFKFIDFEYPFNYRAYDIASITRFYLSTKGLSSRVGCFDAGKLLKIDMEGLKAHKACDDALIAARCLQAVHKNVLEETNCKLVKD